MEQPFCPDYYDTLSQIIANTKIPKGDIYDYIDAPNAEIYNEFYSFCQTNLLYNCERYQIQPTYFFFVEDIRLNAFADKLNETNIIGVFKGLMYSYFELLFEKNDVFSENEELKEIKSMEAFLDVTVEKLMFQTVTQFTYYHELAHVIQRTQAPLAQINEYYLTTSGAFDFESHIREFDADSHGIHFMFFHTYAYWDRFDDANKTLKNFEHLIALGMASIFYYFLVLFKVGENHDMYYKEHTHPHLFIRIAYSLAILADLSMTNFPEINSDKIIEKALRILNALFYDLNVAHYYSLIMHEEKEEVLSYVSEIIETAEKTPYLVINRFHTKV